MAQKRFDTATSIVVKEDSVKIDAAGPGNAFEFMDYTDSVVFSIDENGVISATDLIVATPIDIGEQITSGYISTLTGEDGMTVSVVSGDATVSIGQSVATNANVTFSGLTVTETLTVNGNFTSTGGVNAFSTETFEIDASFILLNSDETGAPSQNAGLEVERGSQNNVSILWNESTDKWTFTNDGSTYKNIGSITNIEDAGDADISISPSNNSVILYDGTKWVDSSFGYSEPVGAIVMMGTSTPPSSKWKVCNGQAISRTTYSELWDLLRNGGSSSPYGNGDGSTTFNVPDIVSYAIFGVTSVTGTTASFTTAIQDSQHTHTLTVNPNTTYHSHSSLSYGSSSNTHSHNAATFADAAPHTHNANSNATNTDHQHNITWDDGAADHTHPTSPGGGSGGVAHLHPYRSTPTTGATSGANPHAHSHSRGAYNTSGILANHTHAITVGDANTTHSHNANTSPTYSHSHNINNEGPAGGHTHPDVSLPSDGSHLHTGDTTTSSNQPHSHTISAASVVYMIKVLP
jgi:hypothetical protein